MFNDFLRTNINGGAYADYIPAGVEVGFAQVEPNHLSAQRTSQVYAQLPAAADIPVLQQGQFVKYDYRNEEVNFTGPGEWMLVYNEIKLYREFQNDCEFAMIKDNYKARVYSPFGGAKNGDHDVVDYNGQGGKQTRYYAGVDNTGKAYYTFDEDTTYTLTSDDALDANKTYYTKDGDTYTAVETPDVEDIATYYELVSNPDAKRYPYDRVTIPGDFYEVHYNDDPFHIDGDYKEKLMKDGTAMVPRVFKTNVGDIFTTNAIDNAINDQLLGQTLGITKTGKKAGFLATTGDKTDMEWQVVKVYTMPDHQKGVKVMRIK